MKRVPRPRPAAARAAEAVAAGTTATAGEIAIAAIEGAEASRVAGFQTRITAIARDSRANRAGNTLALLPDVRQLFWRAKFKEIRWQPLNLRSKSAKKK